MFEFVLPDQGGSATPFVSHVMVERRGEASVHVPIRPLVLGELPVSVKAATDSASASVLQTLLVKVHMQGPEMEKAGGDGPADPPSVGSVQAEGQEQFFSSSLLLEVSSSQPSRTKHVSFGFPPDLVPGSERASVTVVGMCLT